MRIYLDASANVPQRQWLVRDVTMLAGSVSAAQRSGKMSAVAKQCIDLPGSANFCEVGPSFAEGDAGECLRKPPHGVSLPKYRFAEKMINAAYHRITD
jgi:hypothetical protein